MGIHYPVHTIGSKYIQFMPGDLACGSTSETYMSSV